MDVIAVIRLSPLGIKGDGVYEHHYRVIIQAFNGLVDHVLRILIYPVVDLFGGVTIKSSLCILSVKSLLDIFNIIHVYGIA